MFIKKILYVTRVLCIVFLNMNIYFPSPQNKVVTVSYCDWSLAVSVCCFALFVMHKQFYTDNFSRTIHCILPSITGLVLGRAPSMLFKWYWLDAELGHLHRHRLIEDKPQLNVCLKLTLVQLFLCIPHLVLKLKAHKVPVRDSGHSGPYGLNTSIYTFHVTSNQSDMKVL